MLAVTEDSLIQRLRGSLPADIAVAALPDAIGELARPADGGQAYVYYAGLTGRPNPDSTGGAETRLQLWQVLVRHRNRRAGGGLYALLDSVRMLFTGWRPTGAAGKLQLLEQSAPELLDGCWASFQTFAAPTPNLPLPDQETTVRLVRATWENQPHNHETVVEKQP
ncbi:hypothetical protein HA051_16505 [Chromobacterium vaccinii]|nr:hypothetical protein [Chromobacterium vaccinii]